MKHWNIQRILCKLSNSLFVLIKCIRFETNFNILNNTAVDFLHFTLERGGREQFVNKKQN